MEYKNLLDLHTHTDNSPDAIHSITYMCEQAENKGLRAVAFTDHCEADVYYKNHYDRSTKQSFFEIMKARSIFRGKLIISAGIELGQASFDFDLSDKIIDTFNYDIVLASVHNLNGMEDFYCIDYDKNDPNVLLDKYFDEIYKIVKWNGFDVLAHLTYPLRYIIGDHGISIDIEKYSDKVDEILRLLAVNGKALEINTSGLRQKIGKTMPDAPIIKRFRELGGEYITIGSDAHSANDLAGGIKEGMDIAHDCGFQYATLYESRVPIQIPLE